MRYARGKKRKKITFLCVYEYYMLTIEKKNYLFSNSQPILLELEAPLKICGNIKKKRERKRKGNGIDINLY